MSTFDMCVQLREEIKLLKNRIEDLTSPPTLLIARSECSRMQCVVRYNFEWRGFSYKTQVPRELEHDQSHILRYGVEECVRAFAYVELERLQTREVTDERIR